MTTQIQSIELFGVKIHRLAMEQAVVAVAEFLRSGRGHHVVTADTAMLVMAQRDTELRCIVNKASLVVADSVGVLWAARCLGHFLPERVAGVDLAERLCEYCAEKSLPVFFLGGAPGVAEEAAIRMARRYQGLRVVGTHHGFFQPEEEEKIVGNIATSGAKLLLVALGIPKQEKWIAHHLPKLGVSAAIGVGGTLDVFSGRVSRAPVWARRCNLEWLYRVARDPRRIRKARLIPVLVWMTLSARLRGRGAGTLQKWPRDTTKYHGKDCL